MSHYHDESPGRCGAWRSTRTGPIANRPQVTNLPHNTRTGRIIRSMAKRWVLLIMSFPSLLTLAQDRPQARSMVITKRGIVATAQTLASQAGAQVLARGGSAVDAAIAANAVLSGGGPMM